MATSWRCPVPDCTDSPDGSPWQVIESAALVEALVISYARRQHGELPDPVMLAGLRRERVAAALEAHLSSHPDKQIDAWAREILRGGVVQVRGLL